MYRNSQRKVPLKPLLEKGVTPFYFPPLFSFFLRFGQRLSDSLIQGTRRDDCRTNEIVPLRPKLLANNIIFMPFSQNGGCGDGESHCQSPLSSTAVFVHFCLFCRMQMGPGRGQGGDWDWGTTRYSPSPFSLWERRRQRRGCSYM